jgi:hypothetical protein
MRITAAGRVAIGTTNPTHGLSMCTSATVDCQGRANSFISTSDGRLKGERENIVDAIEVIRKFQPMYYRWLKTGSDEEGNLTFTDEAYGKRDVGFAAQDVYKILPEAVFKPEDDSKDVWGMNYDRIVPVLVQGMQDQQDMIEDQQRQIDELREEIKSVRALVENHIAADSAKASN